MGYYVTVIYTKHIKLVIKLLKWLVFMWLNTTFNGVFTTFNAVFNHNAT